MDDRLTFGRINALAAEEEELWERAGDGDGLDASQRGRLDAIRVELDLGYDVLHQRQARRSAGLDSDDTRPRSMNVVESTQQEDEVIPRVPLLGGRLTARL